MLMIIRFWVFVIVMTLVSFWVLRLIGRAVPLLKVFLFWLGVTLASLGVLYGFSLFVASN